MGQAAYDMTEVRRRRAPQAQPKVPLRVEKGGKKRLNPVRAAMQHALQLVGAAEVLHLLFVLLPVYGGMAGLSFWANLLWVLLACARGWAALSLYKMQEDA